MTMLSRYVVFLSLFFTFHSFAMSNEEKINLVITTMVKNWNDREMEAFSGAFTPTASFVTVYGDLFKGARAIAERNVRLHADNNLLYVEKVEVLSIWMSTAKTLVHWVVKNDTEEVVMRGIWSLLFLKADGEWMIDMAHNTAINQAKL